MTLDLEAIDKRIAELRADDEAMSPDWTTDGYDTHADAVPAIVRTRNSLASTADMLCQLRDEVARLTAAAERAVMIADEAFGIGQVEPVKKTLSRIERGIFDQRAEIARMQPVVDICVRICELDELCMARQSLDDVEANAAELEIERLVAARHVLVNAYRASKR